MLAKIGAPLELVFSSKLLKCKMRAYLRASTGVALTGDELPLRIGRGRRCCLCKNGHPRAYKEAHRLSPRSEEVGVSWRVLVQDGMGKFFSSWGGRGGARNWRGASLRLKFTPQGLIGLEK